MRQIDVKSKNATRLGGIAVDVSSPSDGDVLTYNSSTGKLELEAGASPTRTEFISGMIESGADKTYMLDLKAPMAYTIVSLAIKTLSGTCTAAVKIESTAVTGISAVSVTSSEASAAASAANAVSAGNTVSLVLSSCSSAVDISFTLEITVP
jgi:hypothetical protein